MRRLALEALYGAGLLLDPPAYRDAWARVLAEGRRLWADLGPELAGPPEARAAFLAAAGLDEATLVRVLGFGHLQGRAVAEALGGAARAVDEVADVAALFNLGVALFDHASDGPPDSAARLARAVTPAALAPVVRGEAALAPAGDPGLDPLLRLIARFFARCRALAREPAAYAALAAAIPPLHAAQRRATGLLRATVPPSADLLPILEAKSAGVLTLVARVALLPTALPPDSPTAASLRAASREAGRALWLADDLADLAEDWQDGRWSRPWLLHALAHPTPGPDAPLSAALDALLASPIPASEITHLLAHLQALPTATALAEATRASVQAWIDGIPTP